MQLLPIYIRIKHDRDLHPDLMPVKNIDMILDANVVPFVWTEGQPVGLW